MTQISNDFHVTITLRCWCKKFRFKTGFRCYKILACSSRAL